MMEKEERSALTAAFCNIVREYVAKTKQEISEWANHEFRALTDLFDERIKQIQEVRHGKDGKDGKDGLPGERGRDGIDGKSGESIRGADGINGKDGAPGLDGKDGRDGIDGKPGERGETGERGLTVVGTNGIDGKDGRDGREGKDGRDGLDGEPGRDALQLDIIEAQEGKHYPRGSFVAQRGGVVRSVGENIWQTVWCGIDSLDIVQGEDMRSFTVKAVLTSGKIIEKTFSMPVVIDRGVYRGGTEYAMGDAVSQGGSGFVCIVERTTASPAANNRDWRLWIKAGRDGKDLMSKEQKTSEPVRLA